MLEAEKQFIEAAKRNDVESMRTLGKGLNANAKNMVGLSIQHFITLHTQTQKQAILWNFVKTYTKWKTN